jgi:hypothetical protein
VGTAKTWLSVGVELLSGRGEDLWPRPGRVFIVGPRHTFADLAAAIDGAFGRGDRSHLCAFTLETGEIFGWPDPDADPLVTDLSRARVAKKESALTGADLPPCWKLSRGDATTVVRVLDAKDPTELLQHAGEGLLLVLAADHPDARRLTEGVVRGLDLRSWEGDAELAGLLRARAGGWPRH